MSNDNPTQKRNAPIDISGEGFRKLGHKLIDQIADLHDSISSKPVTANTSVVDIQKLLNAKATLPDNGCDAEKLLDATADLLINHSLFNGHPRFWGYITSSAAPIGILGDLLASAINPNVGGWKLSPVASEIEAQTIRWIAELIGFPVESSGILVSGGNMANFLCFLAARTLKADWDVREKGLRDKDGSDFIVYASSETHTWLQKAADMFGMGTDSIRWIATDKRRRMDMKKLRARIDEDIAAGLKPFMVVGTGGSVSVGAVDPLPEIHKLCHEYDLWFHVDGAYGGFAAVSDLAPEDLRGLRDADSIAIDPHKWLYAPLEAGCVLIRDPEGLRKVFAYNPPYYRFDKTLVNYFELGVQNSRGFRALKVWLALKQVGRRGYEQMISTDISLARRLNRLVIESDCLESMTCELSICAFRYVPRELRAKIGDDAVEKYLNELNEETMLRIERSGEAFVSNAIIDGVFALRMCIVNFRTSEADIDALPEIVYRHGLAIDKELRRADMKG